MTSGPRFGLHVVGWCQVYVETSVRWSSRGTAQFSFKLDTSCDTSLRNLCPQCNGWVNVCAGNVSGEEGDCAWIFQSPRQANLIGHTSTPPEKDIRVCVFYYCRTYSE